jgi:hypothetical protein
VSIVCWVTLISIQTFTLWSRERLP